MIVSDIFYNTKFDFISGNEPTEEEKLWIRELAIEAGAIVEEENPIKEKEEFKIEFPEGDEYDDDIGLEAKLYLEN